MDITKNLLSACNNYLPSDPKKVVIKEPYIPFVPGNWNGIIVLAESQNLSSTNEDYVQYLNSLSPSERMKRLSLGDDDIGVYPWDDGSLKLAIEAAFEVNASEIAVSNAVLWSQRGDSNQSINPDNDLQELSSKLWAEFLDILKPNLVICSGNIADSVVNDTGWSGSKIKVRLPSRTAISRISGMFDERDLLIRYPEVKAIIDLHPEWLNGGYRTNKIFYACHVVSLFKGRI